METAKLYLHRSFFGEREKALIRFGELEASAFLFPSGVCGLRIRNSKGELVLLPFQGQQIWSARFCGRDLTMKSAFTQPLPTEDYLKTYGGFLIHCGATAMGVPSDRDSHPLHGELPNMPYEDAYVEAGEDAKGRFLLLGGRARYAVAFSTHYAAEPEIKLYEGATVAEVTMKITNLRSQPMDFMYLCHINFRPFDGARLVYSAPADKEHVKVHFDMPGDLPREKKAALRAYMDRIAEDPAPHHSVGTPGQIYDPEIVFAIKYLAGRDGFAHCMQVMPEGDACYVAFRPAELPVGVRWISRTGDEDAMGMALPATAEHKGYAWAKERGQVASIGGGQSVSVTMVAGYLEAAEAKAVEGIVRDILG